MILAGCGGTWAGGIHARMAYSPGGGLRVVEVPEGPARAAGLEVGDRIVAIDGEGVQSIVRHRTADGIVVLDGEPAEPPRDVAVSRIDERLRGAVGSRVTLRVMRGVDDAAHVEEVSVERVPYAARRE